MPLDCPHPQSTEKNLPDPAPLLPSPSDRQKADIFTATLNGMPQALVAWDAYSRLVVWNRHYSDLFRLPPEMLQVGRPFAEMLRFVAERGDFGPVDIDKVVAEQLASLQTPVARRYERTWFDGRVLEVTCTPMAGGGVVKTFTNLSLARKG